MVTPLPFGETSAVLQRPNRLWRISKQTRSTPAFRLFPLCSRDLKRFLLVYRSWSVSVTGGHSVFAPINLQISQFPGDPASSCVKNVLNELGKCFKPKSTKEKTENKMKLKKHQALLGQLSAVAMETSLRMSLVLFPALTVILLTNKLRPLVFS